MFDGKVLCLVVFFVGNDTKQGGVLSPTLVARYIRSLLGAMSDSGMGAAD